MHFRAGVLFLLQISIIQRILKAAITVKISVKENHVMTKKNASNYSLQKQLISLNLVLQQQTTALTALRKQEAQALSALKSSTGAEFQKLYPSTNSLIRQTEKARKRVESIERQIQAINTSLHALEKKSTPSTTASVPSPIQSIYYPSINVGDYCYHKSYGNGIIYFKNDFLCRVLFSDSLFKTFSYKDAVFKDKTLIIKNAWDRAHGKYTCPFSYSTDYIPSSLQTAYVTFIENLNRDLSSSISKLRLRTSSSGFYAQRALDCIYNIEHGPQVFLSLQSKINSPAPKQEGSSQLEKVIAISPAPRRKKSLPPEKTSSTPPVPAPKPPIPALSIQFKPATDTLYVYSGRIRCIRDKHNMVCANAHIETASGETAILNVNCCLNCNRFYISYDEYSRYMEKYKSLLTRIVLVDESGNSSFTNNLAAESTLKLCGYTVSQEKGFTSKERANLLANIIHNRIVSKPDVIQHLNWLIRMNGKKAGNDIAKEKWEEDLAFVRSLDTNSQSDYQIRHVAPYSSSKKRRK